MQCNVDTTSTGELVDLRSLLMRELQTVPLPLAKKARAPRAKKPYLPNVGTANYTFLVVLWQVHARQAALQKPVQLACGGRAASAPGLQFSRNHCTA